MLHFEAQLWPGAKEIERAENRPVNRDDKSSDCLSTPASPTPSAAATAACDARVRPAYKLGLEGIVSKQ
jgi:hypothetical protein